ncbi:glucuronoxylanase XynC [Kordia sp. SMS9]|uniref:glycoside hydrolase family 30 protein n=1 Tax=Kordia sp. SMS9 TaxID=2282170 RepID=UPI000E0D63A5|nr:glycoside hydrolase family 30 beta sandwich domain-containing protein [Kordia sp. SMS9]AXG70676.1 glucuronoxylanase XynC [Kordia sp. SMS9]
MKLYIPNSMKFLLMCISFYFVSACSDDEMPEYDPPAQAEVNVDFYMTTPDKSSLLTLQSSNIFPQSDNNNNPTISISENETFQQMDGFGFTLTGGSAQLINNMSSGARSNLLNELFGNGTDDVATSYLRISIGASDLDANVFSYNDVAAGQTDVNLNNFSINPDMANLIPVLQEILAINPNIKILATPWSAPVWMKTNENSVGGELRSEYYGTYANYFVKYIQAMEAQGITIDAITVQNEPENPFNNPSMVMTAAQQIDFIGNHLGIAFANANIPTKIIAFDHNPDNTNYPIAVLNNAAANSYIDGSAFHLYAGQINNLSLVHNAHPDKNIYFTEQWIESPGNFQEDIRWHFRELMIGAPRNWSKNVLQWNLAANPNNGPFTDGGCTSCLGAVTIDGNDVTRNSAYYIVAQVAKFVPVNSTRIGSNYLTDLPNVAYKTPNGNIVVIVLNNTDTQKNFNINVQAEPISTVLPAGSVGTYVW